jgi:hypothetical protein
MPVMEAQYYRMGADCRFNLSDPSPDPALTALPRRCRCVKTFKQQLR